MLPGAAPATAAGPTYLSGFDVSRWNVHTPSAKGRAFGFARATYASYEDDRFRYHMANFAKGGLVRGAYAFGVGWQDPVRQAQKFLSVAKNADLLVLDLERDTLGRSMTNAQASHFIYVVHQAGRKIGLYHSRAGFPYLGQDFNWVAQWGSTPPTGIAWAFWQYQGSPVDRDFFHGSATALKKLEGPYPLAASVRVTGSWWEYTLTNGRLSRRSLRTTGFTAQVGPTQVFLYAGLARQLVKLTTGRYAGHYVDRADETYIPAH